MVFPRGGSNITWLNRSSTFRSAFNFFRKYRRRQFLQQKKHKQQNLVQLYDISKDISESAKSPETPSSSRSSSRSAEMTLYQNGPIPLHNDPIPTRGASVQNYSQWIGNQPQQSPVLYSKRVHEVHPSDRHLVTQRVLTVPHTSRTVVTQKPKVCR